MELHERFKKIRKTLKQTQKQYAEELGISQAHLSGVENGKDNPSMPLIKLVCLKYGVNEEWLINEEGVMFTKDNGFDTVTDEGLNSKYKIMRELFEKTISEQRGDNLRNIIQAYSHFVSLISMPGLSEINQKKYLEAIFNINDILEQIAFRSYMLKSVSKKDYAEILQYKINIDNEITKIENDIKKALSCYLIQYERDLIL